MTFKPLFTLAMTWALGCKSTPKEIPIEIKASPEAAQEEGSKAVSVPPSTALKSTPDLVTPGSEEVLNRRGAGTRCPTASEFDALERAVTGLGKETVDLVKEDLVNLKQTMTRSDRDSVASCCNQLEQLVQDTEIMNEDKDSAASALEQIRKTTLQLCPTSY